MSTECHTYIHIIWCICIEILGLECYLLQYSFIHLYDRSNFYRHKLVFPGCMYTCTYIFMSIHTNTYKYMHTHVHEYINTHIHTYIWIWIHTYIHTYTYMHAYTYECINTHMNIYICRHLYMRCALYLLVSCRKRTCMWHVRTHMPHARVWLLWFLQCLYMHSVHMLQRTLESKTYICAHMCTCVCMFACAFLLTQHQEHKNL